MKDILSMTGGEIEEAVIAYGEKPFRAKQIYEWLHKKKVLSYDRMTNVPLSLRKKLENEHTIPAPSIEREQISKIDGTRKYLLKYGDGSMVETVLMKYRHGYSQCISSQIGCRMGCAFCASGIGGLVRNMTAGEMLAEVYTMENITGKNVSNVVVMGTGEPLDNYEELVSFIRLITDEKGRNLGGRQIAVSTCGIVPNILRLAEEDLKIALALSLHAPTDDLRKTIMPVAKKYGIKETVSAMRTYAKKSGRRVTFEYSLIKGVNDSDLCALELAGLIKGIPALVNLIPVNPVREKGFESPEAPRAAAFQKKLEKSGINVTIRREMGRDIDGACGQLRLRSLFDSKGR